MHMSSSVVSNVAAPVHCGFSAVLDFLFEVSKKKITWSQEVCGAKYWLTWTMVAVHLQYSPIKKSDPKPDRQSQAIKDTMKQPSSD